MIANKILFYANIPVTIINPVTMNLSASSLASLRSFDLQIPHNFQEKEKGAKSQGLCIEGSGKPVSDKQQTTRTHKGASDVLFPANIEVYQTFQYRNKILL